MALLSTGTYLDPGGTTADNGDEASTFREGETKKILKKKKKSGEAIVTKPLTEQSKGTECEKGGIRGWWYFIWDQGRLL